MSKNECKAPPGTAATWLAYVQEEKVFKSREVTMLSVPKPMLLSASKITWPQFLMTRTLWLEGDTDPCELLTPTSVLRAGSIMEESEDCKRYLASLVKENGTRTTSKPDPIGLFTVVLWQQLAIGSIDPSSYKQDRTPKADRRDVVAPGAPARPKTSSSQLLPSKKTNKGGKAAAHSETGKQTPIDVTDEGEGDMSLFLDQQEEDSPAVLNASSDEQVVNQALITFVDAVLYLAKGIQIECTAERKRFYWSNAALWQSINDGCLRTTVDRTTEAIIEVKSYRRARLEFVRQGSLRWQESAEMACWIASSEDDQGIWWTPEKSRRQRLLLSQDRDELYIIVASYPEAYIDYVRHNRIVRDGVAPSPFLTMTEYGPYIITRESEMRQVVRFLLAFGIQQGGEQASNWPSQIQPSWDDDVARNMEAMVLEDPFQRAGHQASSTKGAMTPAQFKIQQRSRDNESVQGSGTSSGASYYEESPTPQIDPSRGRRESTPPLRRGRYRRH